MILTLLPNPALDKTVVIPGFQPGQIYRPSEVLSLPGGKGFNFARSLRNLGGEALVVTPLGGQMGQLFLELASAEGLACDYQPVKGALRTCLTIVDLEANCPTELYEKGTSLEREEWELLVERTVSHFGEAQFLVVCGSFPPGVPENGLSELVERANRAGLPVALDTYGEPLAWSLPLAPALVKINQEEAAEVVGKPITTLAQAFEAAAELQRRGAQQVVITLGKQGAVGLTRQAKAFSWAAPAVRAISAVGSGDALLAGIVMGLAQGRELPEALKWGVAAGAANTLQLGAGCFEYAQVTSLLPDGPLVDF